MAEVSHQHAVLLSECYRNSSPRSASTPGPAAPDSPASTSASSSGRVSTSPAVSSTAAVGGGLLSPPPPPPTTTTTTSATAAAAAATAAAAAAAAAAVNCFNSNYHYSQYANHLGAHHPAALGLMGTFLSVGSYSPYAALAATLAAGMSAGSPMNPQQLVPPAGSTAAVAAMQHPLTRLSRHHQHYHQHTLASSSTSMAMPGPRTLPFSVENILKPEFGHRAGAPAGAAGASSSSADSDHETSDANSKSIAAASENVIKQETTTSHHDSIASTPSPSKRFKLDYSSSGNKKHHHHHRQHHHQASSAASNNTDTDAESSDHGERRDHHHEHHKAAASSASSSSSRDSSDENKMMQQHQRNKSGGAAERSSSTELPSDPTKMTDPAKWPAWIFCTRYSDRPSSGPRLRRAKKDRKPDEKRPRTAFTSEQLARLKNEFAENRYLNEKRRQELANELQLHENQIKIWFQNKRAKIKKTTGQKNPLALQLMAQGLYNHSTVPIDGEEGEDDDYHSHQSQNEQIHSD